MFTVLAGALRKGRGSPAGLNMHKPATIGINGSGYDNPAHHGIYNRSQPIPSQNIRVSHPISTSQNNIHSLRKPLHSRDHRMKHLFK